MIELLKPIKDFPDYYISNLGGVFSKKTGRLRKLKSFIDGRGLYLLIGLIDKNGIRKKVLVHRLVATAFVPNPNNLPEVNHKDKNTKNPKSNNLEWCTRKDNLYDSYSTLSPVRNFNSCELYRGDEFLGHFESVRSASRYATSFGASESSLEKYLESGPFRIITAKTTRKSLRNKRAS